MSNGSRARRSRPVKVGSRSFVLLLIAALILPVTVAYALSDRAHTRHALDQSLRARANVEAASLQNYFERARAIALLSSHNPAFRSFYDRPRSAESKLARHHAGAGEIVGALRFLESLYPRSIGEACFIDRNGAENARVVTGRAASPQNLSPDESGNPFFAPTLALHPGEVYQARPYVSPDTAQWVISNSALIPTRDGRKHAFVHFEITVESFRATAGNIAGESEIDIFDSDTGKILIASSRPQRIGAPLGLPKDHQYAKLAQTASVQGLDQHDDVRSAYQRIQSGAGNANHWIVVASAHSDGGIQQGFSLLAILMCLFAVVLFTAALLSFRAFHQGLEEAVVTDALTGLGNRRKLLVDIDHSMTSSTVEQPAVLVLCDLDGFKTYNDTFGHPAGDLLLATLGAKLKAAVSDIGEAYRMGGDEFCALVRLEDGNLQSITDHVGAALAEEGDGFTIRCSSGAVIIPTETTNPSESLRIADRRMYQHKNSARASAGGQSAGVLLQAIRETDAVLGDHVNVVAASAERVALRLGFSETPLRELRQAAQLHDIGKIAIPEAILNKPGKLDRQEWAFMQTHTLVGERIIAAAPALVEVGKLVRSSHERFDGTGYPDGLTGAAIPLGSRIIFICDAFDAISSDRSYQSAKSLTEALAEMRRCGGTQFDPEVLTTFCEIMLEVELIPDAVLS
jgi:diguanylate cyclase (GGDEF)-like protein